VTGSANLIPAESQVTILWFYVLGLAVQAILHNRGLQMNTNGTNGYAFSTALVSTEWVAEHLHEPNVRLVEVSVDTLAYSTGHIRGAVGWSWKQDTQDLVRRDIPDPFAFEDLMARAGISNDTTVVLYGDMDNWFATYAFWLMKYYGHKDVRILNGGRKKWLAENREITLDPPQYARTKYQAQKPNTDLRALRIAVLENLALPDTALVDVRSPDEYAGKLLAPANLPQEGSQRGGHIPGAANIPWSKAVNEDGTFKPADDLHALYAGHGITPDKDVIAYCRIGERSSHTWFVLKYLLGYPKVRNYDGSWTEWGSLIGVPIEKE
jgi:thiosulfate/3-mercaptopyruvate sulfurtransferase